MIVWPVYAGVTAFVLAMFALDLGAFHKKAHEVSVKEVSIWIGLAFVFNLLFYKYAYWRFTTDQRYFSILGFGPD